MFIKVKYSRIVCFFLKWWAVAGHVLKNCLYLRAANLMKMWQTIIISIAILMISFVFLAIKILLTKKGEFPKTHVSQSKAMRDQGIHCVQTQDFEDRHRKGLYDSADAASKKNHTN